MKKILFVLMAAAMLATSCLTASENDALYEIHATMQSYSVVGPTSGIAFTAAEELKTLISDFEKQYGGEWVATYNNSMMFNRQEKDAIAQYEVAVKKFKELNDAFVEKYGKDVSDGSVLKSSYTVKLKRFDPQRGDEVINESDPFVFDAK